MGRQTSSIPPGAQDLLSGCCQEHPEPFAQELKKPKTSPKATQPAEELGVGSFPQTPSPLSWLLAPQPGQNEEIKAIKKRKRNREEQNQGAQGDLRHRGCPRWHREGPAAPSPPPCLPPAAGAQGITCGPAEPRNPQLAGLYNPAS